MPARWTLPQPLGQISIWAGGAVIAELAARQHTMVAAGSARARVQPKAHHLLAEPGAPASGLQGLTPSRPGVRRRGEVDGRGARHRPGRRAEPPLRRRRCRRRPVRRLRGDGPGGPRAGRRDRRAPGTDPTDGARRRAGSASPGSRARSWTSPPWSPQTSSNEPRGRRRVSRATETVSLTELLRRYPGAPGSRRIRRLLDDEALHAQTRSELENDFLTFLKTHDLPLPQTNVLVHGCLCGGLARAAARGRARQPRVPQPPPGVRRRSPSRPRAPAARPTRRPGDQAPPHERGRRDGPRPARVPGALGRPSTRAAPRTGVTDEGCEANMAQGRAASSGRAPGAPAGCGTPGMNQDAAP